MLPHSGEGVLIMVNDHDLFIFQDQSLGYVKPHFAGADDDDFQMVLLNYEIRNLASPGSFGT
jgi:hypothetical protein